MHHIRAVVVSFGTYSKRIRDKRYDDRSIYVCDSGRGLDSLLFIQDLAFTAKSVKKRIVYKSKSICEANFAWIFTCYWNGVNSNLDSPLLERFRAGFFLHPVNPAAEFSLFLGGSCVELAADTLHIGDVDAADRGLDFLLDWNNVKNGGVADQ